MANSKTSFEHKTSVAEAETLNYRWIVLFCSFLVRLLVFGSVMSVGVLYVEWLDEFQLGLGNTALVGSIATGSVLLMGPISGILLDRFSCRQVIIASGFFMSVGLISSTFSNGIPYLCVSFGIVTGCAGGIAQLASIVSLNQYFRKQRPLAMGIGSGGTGVGIFAFGFLQKYFVQLYSWKGSLLILGAVQLHLIVCGMLMVHPDELRSHEVIFNWRSKSSEQMPINPKSEILNKKAVHGEAVKTGSNNKKEIQVDKLQREEMNSEKEKSEQDDELKKRKNTLQNIRSKIKLTQTTAQLCKTPTFWILFFSDFLSWMVQFVPYVHLPERASVLNIQNGSIFISLMGISSALGKVAFGAICTFFRATPFNVLVVAQTLFGLSTVLSPFCLSFWSLSIFSISFGFLSGSYSLMMVAPARLLGEEKFSLAYGFMLAGEGVGVYLGPPLVGWISDATKSYNSSFFLAGCTLLASAMILMIRPLMLRMKQTGASTQTTFSTSAL